MYIAGINVLAVIAAALSAFLLGGLWYSDALFLKTWAAGAGQTERNKDKQKHPAKVFGLSFLFALIAAAGFAYLVGPQPALSAALTTGAIAGACFVAASFGINYQFADRPFTMWLMTAVTIRFSSCCTP